MVQNLWLIPFGFFIGTCGTLIGAGGGFVLMPVLLLIYPEESPKIITGISLAVVFFNALSGSVAYAKMRRIDFKSGFLFLAATIPGAILGALTTAYIPRHLFNGIFGFLMMSASIFLLLQSNREKEAKGEKPNCHLVRNLIEANGVIYTFSYNPIVGVGLSLFVGYISSLLGIGGGIIHVPALVHLLNFPVHIATGVFSQGVRKTIPLAIGVLLGAQLGAKLSCRIHGIWIIRGLAIALGFVGVRILITVL